LPRKYLDATEKYSAQVKLIELPDRRLALSGYEGGVLFPNPSEPRARWKILAGPCFWYLPHLNVNTNGVNLPRTFATLRHFY
jgi:hypothetical protein